jgi:hypothetical protein
MQYMAKRVRMHRKSASTQLNDTIPVGNAGEVSNLKSKGFVRFGFAGWYFAPFAEKYVDSKGSNGFVFENPASFVMPQNV